MINSKKKGNVYELYVRKIYRSLGYDTETSRYANRKRDDEKVDLVNTGIYNIQCKHYKNFSVSKGIQTIKEMPNEKNKLNVLHCKITGKGSVVMFNEDDWILLLKQNKLKWRN